MNLDNPLFIGVLLIVVGLAFALFAYAIFLNRGDEEGAETPSEAEAGDSHPVDSEGVIEPAAETDAALAQEVEIAAEEPELPPGQDELPPDPYLERIEAGREQTEPEPEAVHGDLPELKPEPPREPQQLPVAMLLRDEVTGSIIVKVGDQAYRRPEDISDPALKRNIEFAAIDLAAWFAVEMGVGAPASESKPGSEPQPEGMVAQINTILERNLANSDLRDQAVRLIDDSSGGVRVLIGLDTYDLDEVPDQEISRMIRTAVAEWEASQ